MSTRKRLLALGSGLLLTMAVNVSADTASSDLRAEISQLKGRIAELEGRQNQNWLNERRAEEVKALVREVLSDAETRASLLEGGLTAGHNGQNFFISSEDGSFLLKPYGQLQVRFIATGNNQNLPGRDNQASGFEVRRAKIGMAGHISSPRFQYDIRLATDNNDNDVYLDKATFHYELMEGLWLGGGEDKDPFLREELVDSMHQLAVERSVVNEVFTNGTIQGVWAKWHAMEQLHMVVAITDGPRSGEWVSTGDNVLVSGTSLKAFDQDASDFAITGRVDYALMGTWDQAQDFTGWSGEDTSVVIGAAVTWSVAETGDSVGDGLAAAGQNSTSHTMDVFAWTVDGSLEWQGLNLFGAFVGRHIEDTEVSTAAGHNNFDQYGALVQAGYQILPDKFEVFGRVEWMNLDVAGLDDEPLIYTAGVNWYLNRHATKLSVDVVYSPDSLAAAALFMGPNGHLQDLGLMLDGGTTTDLVAARVQLQLLF